MLGQWIIDPDRSCLHSFEKPLESAVKNGDLLDSIAVP
jgi:hypothetical protein